MTDYSNIRPIRIGSRSSPLALAQAHMVADSLCAAHGWTREAVEIVSMLSSGDKVQDRPLAEIGGKALWTKELERALIEDSIDIAVHSMKDVETIRAPEFSINAMLPRADIRDRLIGAPSISSLAQGAVVGTSSPRRAAQLLSLRPDLQIISLRGNVATRLAKIKAGEADATLLAAAGLDRLDMADTGQTIEIDEMLPAAAQGAIGIDILRENKSAADILCAINHAPTYDCVMAERALLFALGGNCHSPVAAYAQYDSDQIWMRGALYNMDGSAQVSGEIRFSPSDQGAPATLSQQLWNSASPEIRALFALCS